MIAVITPVKSFERAKTRLAACLSATERRTLAEKLCTNTLAAINCLPDVTAVVVADPGVVDVSWMRRARWVPDPGSGLNAALEAGLSAAVAFGARHAVIVPTDLPLLTAEAVAWVIEQTPQRGLLVVPDRFGDGTNALALRPPTAIAPSFGVGSARRHERAARDVGLPVAVQSHPLLSLDLDTPADLDLVPAAALWSPASPGRPIAAALSRRTA